MSHAMDNLFVLRLQSRHEMSHAMDNLFVLRLQSHHDSLSCVEHWKLLTFGQFLSKRLSLVRCWALRVLGWTCNIVIWTLKIRCRKTWKWSLTTCWSPYWTNHFVLCEIWYITRSYSLPVHDYHTRFLHVQRLIVSMARLRLMPMESFDPIGWVWCDGKVRANRLCHPHTKRVVMMHYDLENRRDDAQAMLCSISTWARCPIDEVRPWKDARGSYCTLRSWRGRLGKLTGNEAGVTLMWGPGMMRPSNSYLGVGNFDHWQPLIGPAIHPSKLFDFETRACWTWLHSSVLNQASPSDAIRFEKAHGEKRIRWKWTIEIWLTRRLT